MTTSRTIISLFHRAALVAVTMLAICISPAVADIDDLLRATEDGRSVEVIVKLRQADAIMRSNATSSVSVQRRRITEAVQALEPKLHDMGLDVETSFATLPYVSTTVDRAQMVRLLERGEVADVFINTTERKSQFTTTRPNRFERTQLASSVPSIDITDAWAKGFDGSNTTIAVIDGGFRTTHPMFAGKVVAEACFSDNAPTFDTYTRCPSGATPEIAAGAASNCPAGSDRCDHGTHVASIAAGNDGTNFGVARGAKLLLIDVFAEVRNTTDCSPDPSPCELTDRVSVLKALDHVNQVAAQYNIVAVNLSLGGASVESACDTDPRREVIDMLRAKGIATAAATGNGGLTGKINAPACISSAVAVGATNDAVAVASTSNVSVNADLMAPGVSIRAASGQDNGFKTLSGTSMATPHVAGAFAVLRAAMPTKTIDDIEQALKATGLKTTRADSNLAIPKIQVNKALLRLQGRDKRSFNNVVSAANASVFGATFLRFQNDTATAGTVTVSLREAETGQIVGTWQSPNIPARASMQYGISKLETEARATLQNTPVASSARPYFNLEVESTFTGYMQHIVWARDQGILTNLSACADGLSSDGRTLLNVHSRLIEGYPSRLRIANTGTATEPATVSFYNAINGQALGSYTTPAIPPGAALEVALARIEGAVPALQDPTVTGSNATQQYNVKLENFTGYVQHIVENTRAGLLIDMSPKCELGVR
jgi:subtilisin family serine protease